MTINQASRRISSVVVEYDSRGRRVARTFTDPFAARRFYTDKHRQGKSPKIIAASR
jgi:hypothetical protein